MTATDQKPVNQHERCQRCDHIRYMHADGAKWCSSTLGKQSLFAQDGGRACYCGRFVGRIEEPQAS